MTVSATTSVDRPIFEPGVQYGTRASWIILESTVETDILEDGEFMGRIHQGLDEMQRGESLSFEEVFGRPF